MYNALSRGTADGVSAQKVFTIIFSMLECDGFFNPKKTGLFW